MKSQKEKRELIGRLISKELEKKFKNQEKIKELNLIKEKISSIKNIAKRSNISKNELKKLFQECDLNFWDEEFKDILGKEEKHIQVNTNTDIPSNTENITPEDYKIANKIIKELDEKLRSMTEEERKEYFIKMGFTFEENTNNQKRISKK